MGLVHCRQVVQGPCKGAAAAAAAAGGAEDPPPASLGRVRRAHCRLPIANITIEAHRAVLGQGRAASSIDQLRGAAPRAAAPPAALIPLQGAIGGGYSGCGEATRASWRRAASLPTDKSLPPAALFTLQPHPHSATTHVLIRFTSLRAHRSHQPSMTGRLCTAAALLLLAAVLCAE